MDLLQRARRLLHLYKILPKERLGQNFAVDSALLLRMIFYASVNKADVVLEVGAGLGFLTQLLSQWCKRVVAVEVDPKLIRVLREQLYDLRNVELIEGDVLKVSVPPFNKVVSTPPYSISSPLLFWLLERGFDCAVLTFQREFAERLAAPVGGKDYGRLTVTTSYRAEVELLDHVPRDTFYPPPDVDSMVVRLKPRKEPPFSVEDEEAFFELVQALFTQRNKRVRSAIVPFLRKRGVRRENAIRLADSLFLHDRRVRELAPEDFGALSNEVTRKICEKALLQ
ncbi:MAG: putative ribosomal RNA small subunit methyltransferase A [Candidatus Bathyarchaeota archaeon BA1]|nr:MAG: putative ribosomal RNA small subunit methyltransferase A [Candidatus Bathyarchaeota archaeon BA1]